MSNIQHITNSQWVEFFYKDHSDAQWQALEQLILSHIEHCSDCKQLYEKGEAVRSALLQAAVRPASVPTYTDSAYVAAASYDQPDESIPDVAEDMLSVTVKNAASARFIVGSLDCQGLARQYALNPQNENRALVDDENRLSLLLENGKIYITLDDPDFRCSVRLLADSENPPCYDVSAAHQLALDLPGNEYVIVEIRFTEVDA